MQWIEPERLGTPNLAHGAHGDLKAAGNHPRQRGDGTSLVGRPSKVTGTLTDPWAGTVSCPDTFENGFWTSAESPARGSISILAADTVF